MRHQSNKEYLNRYRRDPNCFGGDLLRGNPKSRRPYSHSQALHVTMRASIARGKHSMLQGKFYNRVKQILRRQSYNFGITVYWFANSGNHIHLLIRPPRERADFSGFIKAFTGLIARLVLSAERSRARGLRFWNKRPFSRIVAWGKPFRVCARYVQLNILEALGLAEAQELEAELATWRRHLRAKPG